MSWEEQYRGEASDTFEKKIEILIKYSVLNDVEEEMLRSIVESIRSLATPTKTRNAGVIPDWGAKCCWDTLYSALIPFTTMREVYLVDTWTPMDQGADTLGDSHRFHRFNIDPEWNPYEMYHSYQLQNDQIRPTLDRPWGSKRLTKTDDGRWMDREWRRVVHRENPLPPHHIWQQKEGWRFLVMIFDEWRLPEWIHGHN